MFGTRTVAVALAGMPGLSLAINATIGGGAAVTIFNNLFNSENVRDHVDTVAIDDFANALGPIPPDNGFRPILGYLSRRFQLGVKLHF